MKREAHRQGGAILFALLALVLLGSVAYLSAAQSLPVRSTQSAEAALQETLARAREALIARAAADDNRPGSLPCPDLLTDSASLSNNFPGDGKGDALTRNQCPSQVGWLPWVTLDMPRPVDDAQDTLWYVIAPGLYDDNNSMPLNSDKATGLSFKGIPEIAALLIAARVPLPGQQRPSRNPADYLEAQLPSGTSLDYVPESTTGNDKILAISRGELMAAVEQNISQRLRHCLAAHARQLGRYPWPAPLGDLTRRGQQASLFGRVPLTQPSEGIGREVNQASTDLTRQSAELAGALTAPDKLTALAQIAEFATRARNLLVTLRDVAIEVQTLSDKVSDALGKLQLSTQDAAADGRISVTEGKTLLSRHAAVIIAVNTLSDALFRYGLDALPWQAAQIGGSADSVTQSSRDALLDQLDALQAEVDIFAAQHSADPRPLQSLLVSPVLAIGQEATVTLESSQLISNHALALAQLAGDILPVAEQTLLASDSKSVTRASILAWEAKPSTSNRTKMETALAALATNTSQLAAGLDDLAAISTSHAAAAWPMTWASAHCAFLKQGTGWWHDNAWAELFFYQIAAPELQAPGHLQAGGQQNLPLLVISAGPPQAGQTRPASTIENYLEGPNADPSRNAPAHQPTPLFVLPFPGQINNDRLAY